MNVLAIDTSSRRRVVCVLAGPDGDVHRALVAAGVDVDVTLPPLLGQLMTETVSRLVVVIGPGSYTGVRAGMAAALGVAHSRGLPLHGVASLDAIAAGAIAGGAQAGWALADAGRNAVYAGRFDGAGVDSWSRVEVTGFTPGDAPVYALAGVPLDDVRLVDPALAVGRAVPMALERSPLRGDGLRALYGS